MHSHFHASPWILTASNPEQFGFYFRRRLGVNIINISDKQEEVGKHAVDLCRALECYNNFSALWLIATACWLCKRKVPNDQQWDCCAATATRAKVVSAHTLRESKSAPILTINRLFMMVLIAPHLQHQDLNYGKLPTPEVGKSII